jgi:hypothetical protein
VDALKVGRRHKKCRDAEEGQARFRGANNHGAADRGKILWNDDGTSATGLNCICLLGRFRKT